MCSRIVVAALLLVSLTLVAAGVERSPPVKKCGRGQEFTTCGTCDGTCDNPDPICTLVCRVGCFCIKPLVRSGDICIPRSQCPGGCGKKRPYPDY